MSEWTKSKRLALLWLSKRLNLPAEVEFDLKRLIVNIEKYGSWRLYTKRVKRKSSGNGFRKYWIPRSDLKMIQKKINRMLQKDFPRRLDTFGFSGGRISDLISKHLDNHSLLMWDIRDAFGQITVDDIEHGLENKKYGYWVRQFILELCFLSKPFPKYGVVLYELPQGSPASGKLFDIGISELDTRLKIIADELDYQFTRYADNYFVSSPAEQFLHAQDFLLVMKEGKFRYHKIHGQSLETSLPILGYSLKHGIVSNRKLAKCRLRKALHHHGKVRELNLSFDEYIRSLGKLTGLFGFMRSAEMPEALRQQVQLILGAAD